MKSNLWVPRKTIINSRHVLFSPGNAKSSFKMRFHLLNGSFFRPSKTKPMGGSTDWWHTRSRERASSDFWTCIIRLPKQRSVAGETKGTTFEAQPKKMPKRFGNQRKKNSKILAKHGIQRCSGLVTPQLQGISKKGSHLVSKRSSNCSKAEILWKPMFM